MLFLISCSPKLQLEPSATSEFTSVPDYVPFAFIETENPNLIDSVFLREFQVKDGGLSTKCSYEAVKALAIKQARKIGGNCIVLLEHRKPDLWSTCHRIKGKIYRISNAADFEAEILWHSKRKLQINDFKGSTESRPFQAATYSSFRYRIDKNIFSGRYSVRVETFFDTNLSYFKRSEHDSLILEHEQLHFDITEIYARQFLARIEGMVTNYQELQELHEAYADSTYAALQIKQDAYDSEVFADPDKHAKWKEWVEKELEASSAFAKKYWKPFGKQ